MVPEAAVAAYLLVGGKIATWNINYYPTYYKPSLLEERDIGRSSVRHQEYISGKRVGALLTRKHLNNISAFEFLRNNCPFFEAKITPPISRQANHNKKKEIDHVKSNIAQRKSATNTLTKRDKVGMVLITTKRSEKEGYNRKLLHFNDSKERFNQTSDETYLTPPVVQGFRWDRKNGKRMQRENALAGGR